MMIKGVFKLLLVLLLATSLGIFIYRDPGYALFIYRGWTIEMPIWALLFAFFILLFLVNHFFKLLHFVRKSPERIREHIALSRQTRTLQYWDSICENLLTAHFSQANRFIDKLIHLAQKEKKSDRALFCYLLGGYCTRLNSKPNQKEDYLQRAVQAFPDQHDLIAFHRAVLNWQFSENAHLPEVLPKLVSPRLEPNALLNFTIHILSTKKAWWELLPLLPLVRKKHLFSFMQQNVLNKRVLCGALLEAQHAITEDTLLKLWKSTPRILKKDSEVVYAFARKASQLGDHHFARIILRKALRRELTIDLVKLYVESPIEKYQAQLQLLQKALKKYPSDPTILNLIAKICLEQKLWGKAREYLEQSLALQPNQMEASNLLTLLYKEKATGKV